MHNPVLARSGFDEEFQDVFDHHNKRHSFDRERNTSRNSTGAKEEFIGPRTISHSGHHRSSVDRARSLERVPESDRQSETSSKAPAQDGKMLAAVFVSMVFVGLGNKVFNKLMTIPMYNYPNFLNLLTSFIFIPVCFAYIIPMAHYGYIPPEQFQVPKKTFAIMGALDGMAGIMQIFGATYLPGPLIILLLQAAIPVSMVISRYLLNAQYNKFQYLGAVIVAGGIMIVLAPSLSGGGSILWAIMLILSTVPMTLSSVYKEIALGETELDAMYLNGWVAVFQFLFSLILALPSSMASEPPVPFSELPYNIFNGLKCYVGMSTYTCSDDGDECVEDKCNPQAPMFVTIYLVFNQFYNLLIILILKYGSANLLYLALTLMVPLGNVAFTLPFVPQNQPLQVTDIVGLIVICAGLVCYRFAAKIIAQYWEERETPHKPYEKLSVDESADRDMKENLFSQLLPVTGEDS